ncbi:MAG TPA: binary toxin-like calcium binding domain-containing protein, partial [Clostridia bacterium]|nr:binary toxin-like calcium binding domain-containing protein [Clostridia bacterium]
MKTRQIFTGLLVCVASGCLGLNTVRADNIASLGTGILGVKSAIDNSAGLERLNAGLASHINDGDLFTRVDNWFGGGGAANGPVSYVGILWPTTRYEAITNLTLTLAAFVDGGWFGAPGSGPGAGGALTAADVVLPTVQVSTDGGTTWTTVEFTSDYLTVMTGFGIGGGANPNPTSATTVFSLAQPVLGVNGIRVIGQNGGTADDNGFLGVFELEVNASSFVDTDNDGLPDLWEQANGLVVGQNDSSLDPDNDGLVNQQEYQTGTNPKKADTDSDGLTDSQESISYMTNPRKADTDGDGLNDGAEVNTYHTDPLIVDTDGDGLSDGAEVNTHHTDPLTVDTDGDGFADGLEVAQGADPANRAIFPNNFSFIGTGIMGTKETVSSGMETPLFHGGVAGNINDGNPATRVDTFNHPSPDTASFVGITWSQPITNQIIRLELTLATYFDGGWFGVNNLSPTAGGLLDATYLIEPNVEVSSDFGSTWTTVAHNSDYLTALNGHGVGGGANPNPTTVTAVFTLTQPANGITGIRIIGSEGGAASGGFLGVCELAVRGDSTDSDHDGMLDDWERSHGLAVGTNDAALDPDGDGLTNFEEYSGRTNPKLADTDGDGLTDRIEITTWHTNPLQVDTDGDGLNDGAEVLTHLTDPLAKDTDGDQFADGIEVVMETDPFDPASYADDLAVLGMGIIGTKATVDSGAETPYFNSGLPSAIVDGNFTTRVDTWNATTPAASDTASYVGVLWNQKMTNPIVRLD